MKDKNHENLYKIIIVAVADVVAVVFVVILLALLNMHKVAWEFHCMEKIFSYTQTANVRSINDIGFLYL